MVRSTGAKAKHMAVKRANRPLAVRTVMAIPNEVALWHAPRVPLQRTDGFYPPVSYGYLPEGLLMRLLQERDCNAVSFCTCGDHPRLIPVTAVTPSHTEGASCTVTIM